MSNVATNGTNGTTTTNSTGNPETKRDVHFDNLEGLAEEGLKHLRDATVAFSDLAHEDGWVQAWANKVEESMAGARADFREMLDELKEAEAQNTALRAEIAALKVASAPASERRVKAVRKAGAR